MPPSIYILLPLQYQVKLLPYIAVILLSLLTSDLQAQRTPAKRQPDKSATPMQRPLGSTARDTLPRSRTPRPGAPGQGNAQALPTMPPVSTQFDSTLLSANVQYASSGIDATVEYAARDSQWLDIASQRMHLYGEASVQYEDLQLTAHYIVIDFTTNIATAEVGYDSLGNKVGLPSFQDATQSFTADKMRFNFKTSKGIVYGATTEYDTPQGPTFILGNRTRFERRAESDTTFQDVIYGQGAIFTTCDHDEPHFGIRSSKQKIIPNKMIIVGPSNLEIGGVPTPLWLPFGFFPITSSGQSGLLFPRDYEFSDRLGFGLRNLGYHFSINDYYNLTLTTDLYTRGTWGINASSSYKKRYQYNGRLDIRYARNVFPDNTTAFNQVQPTFSIRLNHNQDAKAHPYRTFGGSVNFQTNNAASTTRNDAASVLTNTINSNLSYRRTFPGKPYNLTMAFTHSQNTNTRDVIVTLPDLRFSMNRIYPFKQKERIGPERWYEKIGVDYNFDTKAVFRGTDTTFFDLDSTRVDYGARHQATANASFSLFKYINIVPSVNYSETWFFNTVRQDFDPTPQIEFDTIDQDGELIIVPDTVSQGRVVETEIRNRFTPLRQYRASIDANTQLFGTLRFRRGFLRGLRHVVKPRVGFSYTPDYTRESLGYFRRYQRSEEDVVQYSIFANGGLYSGPSSTGQAMLLTYGFTNIFEAKIRNGRDTVKTTRNIKLFDNIAVNGNYNFVADSLNFSTVSVRGTARIFKNVTTVGLTARFDPYEMDEEGDRINRFVWDERRVPIRFDNLQLNFNSRVSLSTLKQWFTKKERTPAKNAGPRPTTDGDEVGGLRANPATLDQRDALAIGDLLQDFNINHDFRIDLFALPGGGDTLVVTSNALYARGSIQLTKNWNISVGNIGYDFKRMQLTYPDLQFYRNLHCWEMGFNWQPVRNAYGFFIRVKPSSLDFINIPYGQNRYSGGLNAF